MTVAMLMCLDCLCERNSALVLSPECMQKPLCPLSLTSVLVSPPLEQHMESGVHRPTAGAC